jgi:hypothetical protein
VTDAATTLGKVDVLGATTLSVAATFLLPKPLNTAGFYLIVDGLMDDLDTYIKDSDFMIAKPLDVLQLLNNNHFIVWFVMQIIKEHITVYSIIF